jgi:hypothetical protein
VTTVSADDVEDEGDEVIFVTGSILKRTDTETPAPVAVLQRSSSRRKASTPSPKACSVCPPTARA